MLAKTIMDAGGTVRDAIRSAILAIRRFEGAEGTYNFDRNCNGLHGYDPVHNDIDRWAFDRHIEFKE
jgi:branched-chain amino acid transport system substrate-binding protein